MVHDLAVSPDGEYFAIASLPDRPQAATGELPWLLDPALGSVQIWRVDIDKPPEQLGDCCEEEIMELAFSPNSSVLALITSPPGVELIDLTYSKPTARVALDAASGIVAVRFWLSAGAPEVARYEVKSWPVRPASGDEQQRRRNSAHRLRNDFSGECGTTTAVTEAGAESANQSQRR